MENAILLRQAIQYNNVGIYNLEGQNIVAAVRSFQDGIACLKQSLDHDEFSPGVSGQRLPGIEVQRVMRPADLSTSKSKAEEFLYFYNRPLLIDEMLCPFNLCTQNSAAPEAIAAISHQVSCVLLFNHALVYHLLCLHHPTEKYHRKALSLYQIAMSLLEIAQYTSNVKGSAELEAPRWYIVLMVLVLNNCAEIHHQEHDYLKTELMRKRMAALIAVERHLFHNSSILSADDLDGLLVNASLLIPPMTAGAA